MLMKCDLLYALYTVVKERARHSHSGLTMALSVVYSLRVF